MGSQLHRFVNIMLKLQVLHKSEVNMHLYHCLYISTKGFDFSIMELLNNVTKGYFHKTE